jgi:hypothetical protein
MKICMKTSIFTKTNIIFTLTNKAPLLNNKALAASSSSFVVVKIYSAFD